MSKKTGEQRFWLLFRARKLSIFRSGYFQVGCFRFESTIESHCPCRQFLLTIRHICLFHRNKLVFFFKYRIQEVQKETSSSFRIFLDQNRIFCIRFVCFASVSFIASIKQVSLTRSNNMRKLTLYPNLNKKMVHLNVNIFFR